MTRKALRLNVAYMPLITAENARELAKRSVEARRLKAERALNAIDLAKALIDAMPEQQPLSDKTGRVEKQLAKLDRLIDAANEAKELNALIQAKERLLNAWALLTGFPRPGTRKAPRTRSNGLAVDPSPAPQPLVSTPAQPDVQTITPDASDS